MKFLPSWLRNKYFIAIAIFAVVLLFLDKNDMFSQAEKRRELNELRQSKAYYEKEIKELDKIAEALSTDPRATEKLAREKNLLKKDNEDLFIISEKPDAPKN